jgi:hypothetical protein
VKYLIILFLFIGFYSCPSLAQSHTSEYDAAEVSGFQLHKTGVTGTIVLTGSPTELISAFGKPNKIYDSEQPDDIIYTVYEYNGAEFFFNENKLTSVIISNSNFSIQHHATQLKIGNNISTLSGSFPNSYALRNNGRLLVFFKSNNEILSQLMIIQYDKSNNITLIAL